MTDYWSLVLFTILGQSAVGLMALLALCRREKHVAVHRTWIAILVLIAAAIASLAHLGDPMVSYFTITNFMTSWLSREILFAGLFGASMLAWAVFRREWLRWLAAAVGIAFVYVMSRVYLIPTEPLWNSPFTFWNFLATSFLLGGSLLLVLDGLGAGCKAPAMRDILLGRLPLLIALAMGLRLVFLLIQTDGAMVDPQLEFLHVALLVAGGGLGLLLLARCASRLPASPKPESGEECDGEPDEPENAEKGEIQARTPRACGLALGTVIVMAFIWGAEICGRVLFYKSYVWFGM